MSAETSKSSFITKVIVGIVIGAVGTIIGTWCFVKFLAPKLKSDAATKTV